MPRSAPPASEQASRASEQVSRANEQKMTELLLGLGAVAGDPADARTVLAAVGLPPCSNAEHTEVFVLNCSPYAAAYLGAEGALGGDAADRVAGFWRALGAEPPAEPDHLTSLLALYAALGEQAGDPAERARGVLFTEHLWSWLPGYLAAVSDLGVGSLRGWADLALAAIAEERHRYPGGPLPAALRDAPAGLDGDLAPRALVEAVLTPVRSGMIITRRTLAAGAGQAGAGHRIGERRFALRAMLEQAPEATLTWLAAEAERWARRWAAFGPDDEVALWWAARARATANRLTA